MGLLRRVPVAGFAYSSLVGQRAEPAFRGAARCYQRSGQWVFVSAVSAWELGIKQSSGKLILAEPISVLIQRFGFFKLPVTIEHGERAAALPLLHKDPFDRMLVAQAIVEDLALVSTDRLLANYPGVRLLV